MCLYLDTCYSSRGAQHRKCYENSPQVRLKEGELFDRGSPTAGTVLAI